MKKEHKVVFTLSAFVKKEDKDCLEFIGYKIQGPAVIEKKIKKI